YPTLFRPRCPAPDAPRAGSSAVVQGPPAELLRCAHVTTGIVEEQHARRFHLAPDHVMDPLMREAEGRVLGLGVAEVGRVEQEPPALTDERPEAECLDLLVHAVGAVGEHE